MSDVISGPLAETLLEAFHVISVTVLDDMRLFIEPVEIARDAEHNAAVFRIIRQPSSLDAFVCRAEVKNSQGTNYRLVVDGEFSLTADIAVAGIGQLQLVYSDGAEIVRKSYAANFHVSASINAVDESEPEFENGLGQITRAAFADAIGSETGIEFYNIADQPLKFVAWPPGSGEGLDEAAADLLYVRQDGRSLMSGDLRMIAAAGIDASIGVYIGGRQASVMWANALQLRRGQAGEPVQVANNDGSGASDVLTVQTGDARYLTPAVADNHYLMRAGGQMQGPLITMPGGSLTNPGLGIGDNATGFYRAGTTLLLSVGGALFAQWLQSPASVMFTTPLNMATYPINNVGAPGAATDAANRAYVDNAVAAVPRPIVPVARTYIATEVTIATTPTEFFSQPFFTNDNSARTILVTVYPQFSGGQPSSFYDLEYTTGLSVGLLERSTVYPTAQGYMGGGQAVCFAATVTPVGGQIPVSLSVRMMATSPGPPLIQIGSRTDQRSYVVIQEMTQ